MEIDNDRPLSPIDILNRGRGSSIVSSDPIEVWDTNKKCDIIFQNAADSKWVMRIKAQGQIEFNRQDFPDLPASEFAKEVVGILQKLFCTSDLLSPWQPIETAPKDGTSIILLLMGEIVEGAWDQHEDNWHTDLPVGDHDYHEFECAKWWMPLPLAPK